MAIIPLTIKDSEAKRMSEQAVKACHKESGIPISELASLLVRMTKEVKEITDYLEKNSEEMQEFFSKNWDPSFLRVLFFLFKFNIAI